MPIEQFLTSLRFEQREKLDQLEIEIGSFDLKSANFGSSPVSKFQGFFNQKHSQVISNPFRFMQSKN